MKKDKTNTENTNWNDPKPPIICPLCERLIPKSQQDAHHLVPKTKGGKETQLMHRICHRQIHSLFSERELQKTLNTSEELLKQPEIQKFVEWVKTKPDEFHGSSKMSNKRK